MAEVGVLRLAPCQGHRILSDGHVAQAGDVPGLRLLLAGGADKHPDEGGLVDLPHDGQVLERGHRRDALERDHGLIGIDGHFVEPLVQVACLVPGRDLDDIVFLEQDALESDVPARPGHVAVQHPDGDVEVVEEERYLGERLGGADDVQRHPVGIVGERDIDERRLRVFSRDEGRADVVAVMRGIAGGDPVHVGDVLPQIRKRERMGSGKGIIRLERGEGLLPIAYVRGRVLVCLERDDQLRVAGIPQVEAADFRGSGVRLVRRSGEQVGEAALIAGRVHGAHLVGVGFALDDRRMVEGGREDS